MKTVRPFRIGRITRALVVAGALSVLVLPVTPASAGSAGCDPVTAAASSFRDVPSSHLYYAAINDLSARGTVNGFTDGSFRPDSPVTRQQFAKMIAKTMGYWVDDGQYCAFSDVATAGRDAQDPSYPAGYVTAIAYHHVTEGRTPELFAPYDSITRAQLITMVARASFLPDAPRNYVPPFGMFSPDHYAWARNAAYAGLLEGLSGVGSDAYDFFAPASRGEVCLMLFNLLHAVIGDWETIALTPAGYSGGPTDADGDIIVWVGRAPDSPAVGRASNSDVFLYSLAEGKMTRLTATYYAHEWGARVSDGRVVWQGADQQGSPYFGAEDTAEVYLCDHATGERWRLTDNDLPDVEPRIDGNTVVWIRVLGEDSRQIWLYDIASRTTRLIASSADSSSEFSLRVDRGTVVWMSSGAAHLYFIATGETRHVRLAETIDYWMDLATDGAYVFWQDSDTGTLWRTSWVTGSTEQIAQRTLGFSLSGRQLAWASEVGPTTALWVRDLDTDETRQIAVVGYAGTHYLEGIGEEMVTWMTDVYKWTGSLYAHSLATGATCLISDTCGSSVLGAGGLAWADGRSDGARVFFTRPLR